MSETTNPSPGRAERGRGGPVQSAGTLLALDHGCLGVSHRERSLRVRTRTAGRAGRGDGEPSSAGVHGGGSSAGRSNRILALEVESKPDVLVVVRALIATWEYGLRPADRAALALKRARIRCVPRQSATRAW